MPKIAVPDLDEATSFYRDVLKGDVTGKEDLPEHGVTTVFVNLPNTKIELLYPYGEKARSNYSLNLGMVILIKTHYLQIN